MIDHYGQIDRIKLAIVTNLCQLNTPRNNIEDLKHFYADFESLYKSVEAQDMSRNEFCAVMLLNKLPSPIKEQIKRDLHDKILDVDAILSRLQTEIFSMEGATYAQFAETPFTTSTMTINQKQINKYQCKLCQGNNHLWYKCKKYPQGASKVKRAEQLNLCVGCLDANHEVKGCLNPKINNCRNCGNKHYNALCTDPKRVIQKEKVDNTEGSQSFSIVTNKHKVILPTLQLPLKGMEDKVINVRALLDQCSQRTFVLRSALPSLQCSKVGQETLQLEGFTKTQDSKTYEIVSLSYIKKDECCGYRQGTWTYCF